MSLPVAHGLLGATVATLLLPEHPLRPRLKIGLTAALLAVFPDLDYLFYGVLDWGESWHRTFSHSVLFALAAGAAAALVVGPRTTRSFVVYSLATFSHPLLDAVISEHPSGVQMLWPLSDQIFGFGMATYYDSVLGGHSTWGGVFWGVLAISAVELLVFGPILIAAIWINRGARGYQEEKSLKCDRTRR